MIILGIETSCDDTAIAVVEDGVKIHSNLVADQSYMHERYGGIIPEISAREHLTTIIPTINRCLDEASIQSRHIDAIAVTHGPGLAGSLLVGVNAAKALAYSWETSLIGINHLEGHIYSAWLENLFENSQVAFPLLCLIASGGHTELVLMRNHLDYELIAKTRDDAAGEAFDKVAKVLGLGFPGGPIIEKEAEQANEIDFQFPRPTVKGSLDFSFSGLKTAVARKAESDGCYPHNAERPPTTTEVQEYAAAFQQAITDCLVQRTIKAAKEHSVSGIILGGGVAANGFLRKAMTKASSVPVIVPKPSLCTDNGAMIASAAYFHTQELGSYDWSLDAIPNLKLS